MKLGKHLDQPGRQSSPLLGLGPQEGSKTVISSAGGGDVARTSLSVLRTPVSSRQLEPGVTLSSACLYRPLWLPSPSPFPTLFSSYPASAATGWHRVPPRVLEEALPRPHLAGGRVHFTRALTRLEDVPEKHSSRRNDLSVNVVHLKGSNSRPPGSFQLQETSQSCLAGGEIFSSSLRGVSSSLDALLAQKDRSEVTSPLDRVARLEVETTRRLVHLVPLNSLTSLGIVARFVYQHSRQLIVDVGQGRGGECQFLSILFLLEWEAGERGLWLEGSLVGWPFQWDKVDAFRAELVLWLEKHSDWCPNPDVDGAPSLRDLVSIRSAENGECQSGAWDRFVESVRHTD